MTLRRTSWVGLMLVASLVVACGGDDASTGTDAPSSTVVSSVDTPQSTAPPAPDTAPSGETISAEACAILSGDDPDPAIIDLVPDQYRDAVTLLFQFGTSLEDEGELEQLVTGLSADGVEVELEAFAGALERDCGDVEAAEGLRLLVTASVIARPPADPDYCADLATVIAIESEASDIDEELARLIASAPPEHEAALATVQQLSSGDSVPPEEAQRVIGDLAGLGLYAEIRCDVPDAFAGMLFLAAFIASDTGGDSEADPAGVGGVPSPADPSLATAALPAGTDVSFEVLTIDVDPDRPESYLASVVAPVGWELDADSFGVDFDPPAAFGIFTELTFDYGCDGLCEVTDWDERLNGPEGYITLYRANGDLLVDRPTVTGTGVVLASPSIGDGVTGIVVRWAEGTDRYFTCEFTLDEDFTTLLEPFLEACEAAVPGWFPASS